MSNPWKERVLKFNKARKVADEKAQDVDVLVHGMLALPPGQLKKLMTTDVIEVLKKYGYTEE